MNRSTVIKLVAIAAAVVILVVLPYVISSYYVSLISIVFISAILASSINMLAGDANLVSLGHAGIAASAGYGLAWASKQGYDLGGQLAVAGIMTVVTSAIYGLISMRTKGIFFLMVTLAAGMVCYGIAFRWSSVTGGDNGLTGISRPPGLASYWQFYFFVLAIFVIVTIALVITSRSPFGLAMRGIRDSETRMRSLGYNVPNYKFVAVFLSGIVAGIAGVLTVWQFEFISPSAGGFDRSAMVMVMVIIGGIGTLFGPLLGATLVVSIEQVLSTYFDRWPMVLGALFIAVVIFAPHGLDGGIRQLTRWFRRRRSPKDPAITGTSHDARSTATQSTTTQQ
jgi:branched-chain amino acid transport system permease protein